MSIVSNLIFNGADHYITSKYGRRSSISTAAGNTSNFHYGTDYGTNGKKIAQYAIEDGTVWTCGRANDGANYVWVKYPRINKKFLHYHLDSISVKQGQSVKKGTLLGYTGQTGKATGIHLHLAVKDLTSDAYEDPEIFAKTYKAPVSGSADVLPKRGYFKKGDESPVIGKITTFMRKVFPSYTSKNALGNIYGPYAISAIKEFQSRTGLEPDGYIGPLTIAKLQDFGLKL